MWKGLGQGKEWVSFWTWQGKRHIRYAVLCGENVQLQKSPRTDAAESHWGCGEVGLDHRTSESLVDECLWNWREVWSFNWHQVWTLRIFLWRKIKILGCAINRQGNAHDAIEERLQSATTAWWRYVKIYRSNDVPWWWNTSMASSPLWVKLVLGPKNSRQNHGMGHNGDESSIPLQKGQRRNMGRLLRENLLHGQEHLGTDGFTLSVWSDRRKYVESHGMGCDGRPNAVIDTLKSVFRWRSTKWWQPTQARGMKDDPAGNISVGGNRGCVWRQELFTLALDSVELPTAHRKEKGTRKKVVEKKTRVLGPADTIIHTREVCGEPWDGSVTIDPMR